MNLNVRRRWRQRLTASCSSTSRLASLERRVAEGASPLPAEKAGHTGTLDPMATGLLPLCFGEATKFSADLLNADKT